MADFEVPVLIVGGGGAGLTASALLSKLGVESLLVNTLPTTSVLPKAHILNQRAMEIMSDIGAADDIYAIGTPPEAFSHTATYIGFNNGTTLRKLECWGNGGKDLEWAAASPLLSTNLPQIRLEPIIRKHAEALAPGAVRFHHELTAFTQDADGVTATIKNHDDNSEYTVRAQFVMACDGGRTIGGMLGVEMVGLRRMASQVSIHLSADFSKIALDPDVLIRWVWVPEIGKMIVVVPMGPHHWGPDSEEWVVHLNYPFEDPRMKDPAAVEEDLRLALGVGDYPMTIHKISPWASEGICADRFSDGRIFLCGDAAHKHPPTGGLGLTSGMHDVQNLTWKLAAVLNGQASEALLSTYETERRSSIERNVRRSLENGRQWNITGSALKVDDPSMTPDEKRAHLLRGVSTKPEDAEFVQYVSELHAPHSMEFHEQNVEYGYTYTSSAVVPDGTDAKPNPDEIRVYVPEARPGHPLPHAWVETAQGERISTVNLVKPGHFLLIAGEDGHDWCEAARIVSQELNIPIDAVRIGHTHGDYFDPRLTWARHRGFETRGAVLVRPDRFIAWRSQDAVNNSPGELRNVLSQVLHRA
jgi:2,4-dichlorophenol 6-monooxygenase